MKYKQRGADCLTRCPCGELPWVNSTGCTKCKYFIKVNRRKKELTCAYEEAIKKSKIKMPSHSEALEASGCSRDTPGWLRADDMYWYIQLYFLKEQKLL